MRSSSGFQDQTKRASLQTLLGISEQNNAFPLLQYVIPVRSIIQICDADAIKKHHKAGV